MTGVRARNPIIFVVDDEPLVRSTICDYFEHQGYTVESAASGDEAYARIAGGAVFDILLTDVRMPGELDGFALIERVRARDPGAKTIAMSGYVGERGRVLRKGDRFIAKPFTITRLEHEVTQALAG